MENEIKKDSVETFKSIEPSESKNIAAIVGFILSWFLTIIPIILCIVGLKKYKTTGKGKRFSIWGIVIVIVRTIIVTILFGVAIYCIKNIQIISNEYCSMISSNYDKVCSLNDDGTYDCFYTTCDFDNVDYEDLKYVGQDAMNIMKSEFKCNGIIDSAQLNREGTFNYYCVLPTSGSGNYLIYKENDIIKKYEFDKDYNYTVISNDDTSNTEQNEKLTELYNDAYAKVTLEDIYYNDGTNIYLMLGARGVE